MKTLVRIKNIVLYPSAYTFITIQSWLARIKSLTKKNKTHFEVDYSGQKILLLALYQKGWLREDIENLLKMAKKLGAYTICINTLKLKEPKRYSNLIDCYIERYNFGRDFGSYKTAFLHIYKRHWDNNCPRVLMLNDSVFYSRNNLEKFLSDMLGTDIEVLGATENHEIEHHLGSFCISIHGSVVRNMKLHDYWRKYSNSDVRPKVIKRGEMDLSKTLRQCVTTHEDFRALFDIGYMIEFIKKHPSFLNIASIYYRASDRVDWNRPSIKGVFNRLAKEYFITERDLLSEQEISLKHEANLSNPIFVSDFEQLSKAVASLTLEQGIKQEYIEQKVFDEIKNDLLDCFVAGSQIHQNNIILYHIGLPIIKLDGLYRGMFSSKDVENIAAQLSPDESMSFRRLMYSKPFGGSVLFGWKRAAFYRGLI